MSAKKDNLWKAFAGLVVVWIIGMPIGELLAGWGISHWPLLGSLQAHITADATTYLIWQAVAIYVLVGGAIVYSAVRFRASSADDDTAPVYQRRNWAPLAVLWLVLSIGVNLANTIYPGMVGLEGLWTLQMDAKNPLVVDVTAQQWKWTFSYPKQGVTDVSDLIVPVGRTVEFVLRTKDVMHDFWVPAWGVKKDVIPNEVRHLYVTPTVLGSTASNPMIRVQCALICGNGHSMMRAPVKVVTAADFKKWVASNSF
ncbi:MAG: cytochrome c oxidase subunit II [Acidiferrobacter sp.]